MKALGLLLAVFLIGYGFSTHNKLLRETKSFIIEPESRITISGSSNVTDFTCCCESTFNPKDFSYHVTNDNKTITFQGAEITIRSGDIDCGGKVINRDMQKALRSDEYPMIRVSLRETNLADAKSCIDGSFTSVRALTEIQIAEVAQSRLIDVEVIHLSMNTYQLRSSAFLKLSDFNLDTPRPVFGLIKVADLVSVTFSLVIRIQDSD